jgi:hypothetical protein
VRKTFSSNTQKDDEGGESRDGVKQMRSERMATEWKLFGKFNFSTWKHRSMANARGHCPQVKSRLFHIETRPSHACDSAKGRGKETFFAF